MFHKTQFKDLIGRVLLSADKRFSSMSAVNLLMGTAAVESKLGTYLRQIKGPALGVFQMEPETERDIWVNFLAYRPVLESKIQQMFQPAVIPSPALEYDIGYQIVMARLQYYRAPTPLPTYKDISGLAKYWKKHYNTSAGAGVPGDFIRRYLALVV